MLSTVGSRLARPAAQVARIVASPPRARFTAYTAARAEGGSDASKPARARGGIIASPASFGLARRPSRLATDLFFPEQVGSIFRDIEDEISRLWGGEQAAAAPVTLGAVDVRETKDAYSFKMDAPGLTKTDITVRMTPDNVLVIAGERATEARKEGDGFQRFERAHGKFQRRFVLPDDIDAGSIKAEVKNGELVVVVPRKESETKQTTEIPVEDAAPAAAA